MLASFCTYCIWSTENLVKILGNVLTLQPKILVIVAGAQAIKDSQRLMLEFIELDLHHEAVDRLLRINLKQQQVLIKGII